MRADRLINIMILLQNKGKMTTKELSETLEVSARTIIRDMDALSVAGIPVVADRGSSGGWRLLDAYRSTISGIKPEELPSLFILPSEKLLTELGIRTDGLDIRQKLIATLPDAVKTIARHYADKVYIDTGTWKPAAMNTDVLHTVQQALWEDKQLELAYKKANGEQTQIRVSPLGLVSKGNAWYLVALTENGEFRNYKVSRMMRAEMRSDVSVRPDNFVLGDYWNRNKVKFAESLPQLQVIVLADASVIGRMTFTDKFVQRIEESQPTGDGEVQVALQFNSEQEAVEYVLGFGDKMRLLQPEHLIENIVARAKSVVAMYEPTKG